MSHLSYKTLFIILFLLLIPIVFLLRINQKRDQVSAAWWNETWMYRQAINISSHTNDETDVYITATISLNTTDKAQADAGDFRFLNSSGQILPYYVVSGAGTTSINFHINLDFFPAGAQTLYAYYGNPSATNGFSASDFTTQASNYTIGSLGSEEVGGGPIAYWKFDEGVGTTAYDSTSNQNHGIIYGTTWKTEDQCISGKCLSFIGNSNDYVRSNNTITIPNEYTLSTWVYGDRSSQINENIYIFGFDGYIGLALQDSSQNIRGGILIRNAADTSYHSVWNGVNLLDNKWHYLTATVNRSTLEIKIYIDGKLNKTTTIPDHYSGSKRITIGSWGTTYGNFTGLMDEPIIFPYARTADQIKADYTSGLAGMGTSSDTSVSFGGSSNKFLSDGLVGYWKFDEGVGTTTTDSSGNNNTATLGTGSSAPSWGSGKFGIGVSFNSSNNNYIDAGSAPALTPSTAITLSAWVKASGTQNLYTGLIDNQSGNYGYSFRYTTDNKFNSRFGNGSTTQDVASFGSTPDGVWTHVTLTFDGNQFVYYFNGVAETPIPATITSIAANSNHLLFGSDYLSASRYFNGLLDEVRVYNRALSPTEVKQLYDFAPGPIAYWKMDEGSGTVANDISGNNNYASFGTGDSAPSWTTGKYGKGLFFDSTNDYLQVTSPSGGILNPKYTISVDAWVKFNETLSASYRPHIIGKNASYFLIGETNQKPRFWIYDTTWRYAEGTSNLVPNTWYHLSGTYDGSTIRIYVNGKLENSAGPYGEISQNSNIIEIGRYGSTASHFVSGIIDNVRIYNYARTQKQILEDMNAGSRAGPLIHYKFDEGYGTTVNNFGIGGTINGTLGTGNSSPTWVQGKVGKALSFNGTNNYVRLPNSRIVDPGTGDYTWSGWLKFGGFTGTTRQIYMANASGGATGIGINLRSTLNEIVPEINGTLGGRQYSGRINVTPYLDQWHHWTFVLSSDDYKIKTYVNGNLISTLQYSDWGSIDSSSYLYFGSHWTSAWYYDGLIDEVKIYNYALTADEIKSDYNQSSSAVFGVTNLTVGNTSTSALYCIPGSTDPCSPPVAEWKFDEGVGTTAYDTSGNNNNVSLVNTIWSQGKIGKSLSFNGSSSVLDIPDLSFPGPFTYSFWLKNSDNSGTRMWSSGSGAQKFGTVSGKFFVRVISSSDNTISLPAQDTWHHVTLSRNSSDKVDLYLDGILKGRLFSDAAQSGTTYLSILGRANDGSGQFYSGQMDQVRIYNYARTPAQIAWDYNQGAPVGHWKLDECQGTTIHDSSGNANHGTLSVGASGTQSSPGTCTTSSTAWGNGSTGKINSSLNFDGSDDYVNITNPSNNSLDFGTGDFTTSFWAKLGPSIGNDNIIAKRSGSWSDNTRKGFEILWNSSNTFVVLTDGTNGSSVLGNGTHITQGTWTHITYVFDRDSNLYAYVNGKLTDSDNITSYSGDISNSEPFYIGSRDTGSSYNLNGQIDDVRIYNYALTSDQIKQIYNGGAINFN